MENLQLHNPDNPCHQKSVSDRKFVIFDLDGTLIDSFECVLRCVNKALDTFVLPHVKISPSERSNDIDVIFEKVKETIKDKVSFNNFKALFDSIHLDDCIENVGCFIAASQQMIEHNNDKKIIVILTNKKDNIAKKIMAILYPDITPIIIGRQGMASFKTKSVIYTELSNRGIPAHDCVCYYGDSYIDFELANYLRIPFRRL